MACYPPASINCTGCLSSFLDGRFGRAIVPDFAILVPAAVRDAGYS
jgi:hypothetical protein